MFKEKYISKFIFVVPILFIILTSGIFTFLHIKNAEKNFQSDFINLKQNFLKEEQLRLEPIVSSINSYIKFKKATSINIVKNKIKLKVDIAESLLSKHINKDLNTERISQIKISLLSDLNKINNKDTGRYFINDYSKKENSFLSNTSSLSKEFIFKYNELLGVKKEGYIVNKEFYEKNLEIKELTKLTYIKNFEKLKLTVSYSLYLNDYEKITKKEVLNRLNLMSIETYGNIFTLDKNFGIIQNLREKQNKKIEFKDIEKDVEINELLWQYQKKSKADLSNGKYEYIWKEINKNTYKLYVFNYVDTWDWVITLSLDISNISTYLNNIKEQNELKREEIIKESTQIAAAFVLVASILSYFLSIKINQILTTYQKRIESQKNALRNINATLEVKVVEKTNQLEILNDKLKKKFKDEVRKNRKKDQMVYSQSKMAAMGEMIGNIAHQWRQPLSIISTIASGSVIKVDYKTLKEDDLKKDLQKIIDTTKHLSSTIDDFRNFFIDNKEVEKFDLVSLMEKNINLIAASMQNNYIKVITNFNSIEIKAIKNELLQAVLNILNNARDSVIEQIEGKRVIVIDVFKEENEACIVIKDSGGGIPKENLEKIFQPYFTTKEKSLGTGVGLYMTKQILVNHMNGKISVNNEEFIIEDVIYNGASFKISLPMDNS
ncbi:sensor histidine kinase [Poseidonibacter lekithochrous]|uniref:sensor histidine kinase n=1 Tax=Poseidonibacter lekithochrous TaxID=1904463 RepID=UPI000D37E09F|nr:cache domain-containing protein [Poseidonibacter lekithochrous]